MQFNDIPVARWWEERVGASNEEKKFLMGMVMADRNTVDIFEAFLWSKGPSQHNDLRLSKCHQPWGSIRAGALVSSGNRPRVYFLLVIGVCLIAFHISHFIPIYLSPLTDVARIHHDGIIPFSPYGAL